MCHLELQPLVDVVALEEGQHGVAEEVGGRVQLVVGDPGEGGEHRLLAERRHHHQQLHIVAYNTTQHNTPIIVCLSVCIQHDAVTVLITQDETLVKTDGVRTLRPMHFQPMQFQPLPFQPLTISTYCIFNRPQFRPKLILAI